MFWSVPASSLKHKVFEDLKPTHEEDSSFYPIYPTGYDEEHFQQLFSEAWRKVKGRFKWVSIRHRNEVLDLHVYNYAMYYLKGLNHLNPEDWDGLADMSKKKLEMQNGITQIKTRGRMLSNGFSE